MLAIDSRQSNKNLIQRFLFHIKEYQAVKNKTSTKFKTVGEFYKHYGICRQNFLKVYKKYIIGIYNPAMKPFYYLKGVVQSITPAEMTLQLE